MKSKRFLYRTTSRCPNGRLNSAGRSNKMNKLFWNNSRTCHCATICPIQSFFCNIYSGEFIVNIQVMIVNVKPSRTSMGQTGFHAFPVEDNGEEPSSRSFAASHSKRLSLLLDTTSPNPITNHLTNNFFPLSGLAGPTHPYSSTYHLYAFRRWSGVRGPVSPCISCISRAVGE